MLREYVDFFFQLNMPPPNSLRLQGDLLKIGLKSNKIYQSKVYSLVLNKWIWPNACICSWLCSPTKNWLKQSHSRICHLIRSLWSTSLKILQRLLLTFQSDNTTTNTTNNKSIKMKSWLQLNEFKYFCCSMFLVRNDV